MRYVEGPLVREFREINEGKRELPRSHAKRHHFVPAFLLANFATPHSRKGFIHQLDTGTGKPQRTTPDSTAFLPGLYAAGEDGQELVMESFLSVVERHASGALGRLVSDPRNFTVEDRQTVCHFLALQHMRTPAAMDDYGATNAMMYELRTRMEAENATGFYAIYRDRIDPDATAEEAERFRLRLLDDMDRLHLESTPEMTFTFILESMNHMAEFISDKRWMLLEAAEGEFVTSDRALAMHDENLEFPWSGHAWESSETAETTIALTPRHCLLITPGQPFMGGGEIGPEEVRAINLRTYGWASRYIYGASQEVVSTVRRQAKKFRKLVTRPRRTFQVIVEEVDDPTDPSVGVEHLKRGWPRLIEMVDDDGSSRVMGYTVLEPGDRAAMLAAVKGTNAGSPRAA